MATNTLHSSVLGLSLFALLFCNQALPASENLSPTEGASNTLPSQQEQLNDAAWAIDWELGWDSKYVSQGRNNLDDGGIYWMNTAVEFGNLTAYALVGRGDNQNYTEWNLGLEFGFNLTENLETTVGYQRIEVTGDYRCWDNEIFAELAYTTTPWLVPSVSYVYSTEMAGYFVELSLHSDWELSEKLSVAPYISQGFDFKYRTKEHDGRDHLQFGLEASYAFSDSINLTGHISHSVALRDIELEAEANGDRRNQNQSFAGININLGF
ncbi:hypothetical protein [Shewanella acanthi]|uniref:hypothetical protein n=1 Tax=Shewanella acanthi TaxID=2864212 RepID=UPI001C65F25B|nr:hypothetical protein [Shewanella acanthi]QYJ78751.1 hypothetical protein K0H61_17025 [Shewanella acanthi]